MACGYIVLYFDLDYWDIENEGQTHICMIGVPFQRLNFRVLFYVWKIDLDLDSNPCLAQFIVVNSDKILFPNIYRNLTNRGCDWVD